MLCSERVETGRRCHVRAVALALLGLAAVAWCSGTLVLAEDGAEAVRRVGPSTPAAGASSSLESYDIRTADGQVLARLAAEQRGARQAARDAAARALAAEVSGVQIDYDTLWGTPRYVRSLDGYLTRAVSGDVEPREVVYAFVDAHAQLFGVTSSELRGAHVKRLAQTAHNGLRTIWWQQTIGGHDVLGAEFRANVLPDGRIVALSSTMVSAPAKGFVASLPTLTTDEAVRAAARQLGVETKVPAARVATGSWQRYQAIASLAGGTQARLVYFPLTSEEIVPAYQVILGRADDVNVYSVVVDAADGKLLARECRTFYAEPATFRVYADGASLLPYPSPTPAWPGPNTPDPYTEVEVPRVLITDLVALDPNGASPGGWVTAGQTALTGNNVELVMPGSLPVPSDPNRVYDFALDLDLAPATYVNAAAAHAFFVCNWYHDRLYGLGFTEAYGNYQSSNFGAGGEPNDPIHLKVQDPSGVNNAYCVVTEDGVAGTVGMFLWDCPNPDRDGDLASDVLVHEFTHGLVGRLVGVDAGLAYSVNQYQGLHEGWADFFGLALLVDPNDDPNLVYAQGGYVAKDYGPNPLDPTVPNIRSRNHYFGLRRYPYSANPAKNPLTFNDIDVDQCDMSDAVPLSPVQRKCSSGCHPVGEVWCAMLWDCRARFLDTYGVAGNELFLQLVLDGMKLCPPRPNFIQARDAILLADALNNDGANWTDLWEGFRTRGLGASAASPNGERPYGVIEAFDMPTNRGIRFWYGAPVPRSYAGATPPSVMVALTDRVGVPLEPNDLQQARLNVTEDGLEYQIISLTLAEAPNVYTATFPAQACGAEVSWFLSVQSADASATDPPSGSQAPYRLARQDLEVEVFVDDFEADRGWTVGDPNDDAVAGVWERCNPQGSMAQPPYSHTTYPDMLCYVTQATSGSLWWDEDVDWGVTSLTSRTVDCTAGDAYISYYFTFFIGAAGGWGSDLYYLDVELSNDDGQSWVNVETVNESPSYGVEWLYRCWRVADFVTPTSETRIRFRAHDASCGTGGADVLVAAALDAVRVFLAKCCLADLDGDNDVDGADQAILIANYGMTSGATYQDGDLNGDGAVGLADLAILLGQFGECP